MLHRDVIDAIGYTPLLALRPRPQGAAIYAKLEMQSLYGMKDRVAKQAILEAKASGILQEGAPIIESSSGTLALGVAMVGTYLGHPVHIVTDPRLDPITRIKLQAMGCTVHVVERMTDKGWQGARLELLHQLMEANPGAFWPRQYDNPANPRAYEALAAELVADIETVDILVGSVGSGGSLCGTAQALQRAGQRVRVVGVDAVGSVIFGQPDRPSRLQGGLGNSLVPPNVKHEIIDEVHWLNDEEAFAGTLALARHEKIFAGNSSGSVYVVARWLAQQADPAARIVAIFPDRGDRYFGSIYDEVYRETKGVHRLRLPDAPQEVAPGTVVTSWSYQLLKKRGEMA